MCPALRQTKPFLFTSTSFDLIFFIILAPVGKSPASKYDLKNPFQKHVKEKKGQ